MDHASLEAVKKRLRRDVLARRRAQADPAAASRQIFQRLTALPAWSAARSVLSFVHMPGEVHTQLLFPEMWRHPRRLVVPWCQAGRLELFELRDLNELAPGTLGILEPTPYWRQQATRVIAPGEVDLVIVPGVAFDRRGGRLGYGKGYFDRLLAGLRPDALRAAVAFQCQIVDEVPMLPHDVPMHLVITEQTCYAGPPPAAPLPENTRS